MIVCVLGASTEREREGGRERGGGGGGEIVQFAIGLSFFNFWSRLWDDGLREGGREMVKHCTSRLCHTNYGLW